MAAVKFGKLCFDKGLIMTSQRSSLLRMGVVCLFMLVMACGARAQSLRFSNHRDVAVPDYATVRIGPLYSTMRVTQSVGYRYTDSSGTGTDYIFENARGEINEDGSEIPLITSIDFRNYLLITPNVDLDASFGVTYEYYPMDTQDDDFYIDFVEEGAYGNLSMAYHLAPNLAGTVYDKFGYQSDFVDTRGLEDETGGSKYRYMNNVIGSDLDWIFAKHQNLGLSLSREDQVPHGKDEFDDQDRITYRESLGYEYQVSEVTVAGAEAAFYQNDYELEEREDSDSQEYTVFVESKVTEHSLVALSIGVSDSSTSDTGSDVTLEGDDGSTVIGSASLETELREDLSHSLSASRSERGGFNSAFEIVDTLSYHIDWQGTLWAARAYTTFTGVEPSSSDENDYTDWVFGGRISIPVVKNIDVYLASSYRIRDNDAVSDPDIAAELEEEDLSDYETWSTRLGTSFGIYQTEFSDIIFSTYVQHTDRTSDSEDLAYERDIIAATFTYSHQF